MWAYVRVYTHIYIYICAFIHGMGTHVTAVFKDLQELVKTDFDTTLRTTSPTVFQGLRKFLGLAFWRLCRRCWGWNVGHVGRLLELCWEVFGDAVRTDAFRGKQEKPLEAEPTYKYYENVTIQTYWNNDELGFYCIFVVCFFSQLKG